MSRPAGSKNKINKVVPNLIKSSIKIAGQWTKAEGATVAEAIDNLHPVVYKGVAVLVLEQEERKKERILRRDIVFKLFGPVSGLSKEIARKGTIQLFEGF